MALDPTAAVSDTARSQKRKCVSCPGGRYGRGGSQGFCDGGACVNTACQSDEHTAGETCGHWYHPTIERHASVKTWAGVPESDEVVHWGMCEPCTPLYETYRRSSLRATQTPQKPPPAADTTAIADRTRMRASAPIPSVTQARIGLEPCTCCTSEQSLFGLLLAVPAPNTAAAAHTDKKQREISGECELGRTQKWLGADASAVNLGVTNWFTHRVTTYAAQQIRFVENESMTMPEPQVIKGKPRLCRGHMQAYQSSAIGMAFTKLEAVLFELERTTVGDPSRSRAPDAQWSLGGGSVEVIPIRQQAMDCAVYAALRDVYALKTVRMKTLKEKFHAEVCRLQGLGAHSVQQRASKKDFKHLTV